MKDINFALSGKSLSKFIKTIYDFKSITLLEVSLIDNTIIIEAKSRKNQAICPVCGRTSKHKRVTYIRTLYLLPLGKYPAILHLHVNKYECKNKKCSKHIFSEQIEGVTTKYARYTKSVIKEIIDIGLEVSANKASYFFKVLKINISASSCLRWIKTLPMPSHQKYKYLSIDDWAKRKGISYGSIIIDQVTHKPIDLIDSRQTEDVVKALNDFNNVKLVTRDRATSYSYAIKSAFPSALQIADKFHIIKNLSERILKIIKEKYKKIKLIYNDIFGNKVTKALHTNNVCKMINDEELYSKARNKQKEMYHEFHILKKKGYNISQIANITKHDRYTISQYLNKNISNLSRKTKNNYNKYIPNIMKLMSLNISISAIYKALVNIGFKGNERSFRYWLNNHYPDYAGNKRKKTLEILNKNVPVLPSPIIFSILLQNKDFGISKKTGEISQERICVDIIIEYSPKLLKLQKIYLSFKTAIIGSNVENLRTWYIENYKSVFKEIISYCNGLKKDWSAVCNAIIYDMNNGLAEGSINRLKAIKRSMYNRAGFELLRRKICLSKCG